MSEKTIIDRLDDYIEFATATKSFSDVGFYEDLKAELNTRQDNWISVEDRMPELNKDVLVYHKDGDVEVRRLVKQEAYRNGEPVDSFGWYPGGSFGCHSHWQPLPSSPKEV